ncbi:MAG: EVE domain-containing protein [Myxococcota bacterium]
MATRRYWLMKSEPDVYSIEDLKREQRCYWEGIRNYQARNFMRDAMQIDDLAFFYHSNAKPPGIVGVMRIVSEAYPDPTQFDPKSQYFDPKSEEKSPRWSMVDVAFVEQLPRQVTLNELRDSEDALQGLLAIRKGQRLSIQPVEADHFQVILGMGGSSLNPRRS